MATYQFSALADGQSISFSPTADVLNFDQMAISGADIRVTAVGTNTLIEVAGKDVTLLNVTPLQLTTLNVTFADGSRVVIGDNSTATNDNAANQITASTSGDDLVMGLGGNDNLIVGNGGDDVIDGGANFDTMSFSSATNAIVVDFATGTVTGIGNMVFTSIERVIGSGFGDVMNGAAGAQNLTGGGGEDTLWGGDGVDALWGNQDADTFVFRELGSANADKIGDFATGFDQIMLDGSVLTALGATGNFATADGRFYAAAGATTGHDADDRIIFNTTTQQLFYDADGSGSGGSVLILAVQSTGTITATDIAVMAGSSGPAPIIGTESNDTLMGTDGPDTIEGRGGNDSMRGNEGADLLIGGTGSDTLDGRNSSFGENDADVDTLDGGTGNDVFWIDNEADVIADAGGIDTLIVENILSWTLGAEFENLILANAEEEVGAHGIGNELDNRLGDLDLGYALHLEGRAGNDTLLGSAWGDTLEGGDGNDSLVSIDLRDSLSGGNGADTLVGGWDDDTLSGGAGADSFVFVARAIDVPFLVTDFASGTDELRFDANAFTAIGADGDFVADDARFHAAPGATTAHDADDRIIFNTSTGQVFYDPDGAGGAPAEIVVTLQPGATLVATDIAVDNGGSGGNPGELIVGTNSADALQGGAGDDTIQGLEANDTISISLGGTSSYGDDIVDGGSGFDALDFNGHALNGIVADFNSGIVTGGDDGTGSVTFVNIERIVAGAFNDHITGNAAANNLDGRDGDDTLLGGGGGDVLWGIGGNDWLQGGTGVDTVNGSLGADRFVFAESGSTNADKLRDFVSGTDDIYLDDAAFAAIGALGSFAAGDARFASGADITTGQDSSDRIIYNTTTDSLYYDADGSGSGGSVLIATFTNNPTLTATDLFVF